ncbi:MAG: phosphoribosylformylglycinamidine cyclo-ligase [Chloroflexota bacterium]|nr:phosphoribosylformylglycinamidine cyclo-ligase [Chloroflexota bacterium]
MATDAYRQAGVDRGAAGNAKDRIFAMARSTFTPGVLGDIGAFGALYKVTGYRDPVLVAHTDGVGTKLRVASLMGRYDTVGEDIVHHCTNDILTCGAQPLFFLDYMGMGALSTDKVEQLVEGLARACRGLDCALIGGETAEMPGMYHGEDVELVGFVVGAVEREGVIDGSSIRVGDALLALPSSGLHTNGYSLVRRVFGIDDNPAVLDARHDELGATLGEALLVPHRSYVAALTPALDRIKGMAHITGGGFPENVPRMLPERLSARLEPETWAVPPLFRLIQRTGGISEDEMRRVFNMGVGMIVAVAPEDVAGVRAGVPEALVVGEVADAAGGPQVIFS